MAARNHGKPWTKPEIAELRKSYRKVLHRELATKLGRTLRVGKRVTSRML